MRCRQAGDKGRRIGLRHALPQWGALLIDRHGDELGCLRQESADRALFVGGSNRRGCIFAAGYAMRLFLSPLRRTVLVGVVMAASMRMSRVIRGRAATGLRRVGGVMMQASHRHGEQIAG